MTVSRRNIPVQFDVSAEELEMIREKMAIVGTENLSAYLRKVAIDGQIIKLDLPELKEARILLRHTSDNFNQLTKRVNATGRLYNEDLADMKSLLNQVWDAFNGILQRLARLS